MARSKAAAKRQQKKALAKRSELRKHPDASPMLVWAENAALAD